jgi:hypothetical protein
MSKQNALNVVFDKAVQALESKAATLFGTYEFREEISIEEPKPAVAPPATLVREPSTPKTHRPSTSLTTSPTKKFEGVAVPRVEVPLELLSSMPPTVHQRSLSQASFSSNVGRSQASSSNSQGPPSTHRKSQDTEMSIEEPDSRSTGERSRSRHSKGRGSVYSVSSSMSVTSTGTRRSTRSRTSKVIIESDDENAKDDDEEDEYELSP